LISSVPNSTVFVRVRTKTHIHIRTNALLIIHLQHWHEFCMLLK